MKTEIIKVVNIAVGTEMKIEQARNWSKTRFKIRTKMKTLEYVN